MDFSLRTDLKAKHLSCVEQNADNACCVKKKKKKIMASKIKPALYFYILKIFIDK